MSQVRWRSAARGQAIRRVSATSASVSLDDLPGRDQVDAHRDRLSAPVIDKSVMLTRAGGSIGGEPCRQIVALHPKRLTLFERSGHALYEIERELLDLLAVKG
jgi:FlaA1/EpsC-like NDP-sugar epimerase